MRNDKSAVVSIASAVAVFIVSVFIGSVSRVDALPIITLTDALSPAAPVVISDWDYTVSPMPTGLDANPLAGSLMYSGGVGTWDVQMTFGVTKPTSPVNQPIMNLQSFSASKKNPADSGDLIVVFNETDFNYPVPVAPNVTGFINAIGGFAGGSIDFNFYYGEDNDFDYTNDGAPMTSVSVDPGDVTAATFSTFYPPGSPVGGYALSIVALIHHDPNALPSTVNASIGPNYSPAPSTAPVPEPSIGVLLCMGLAGIAGGRFVFKRGVPGKSSRGEG